MSDLKNIDAHGWCDLHAEIQDWLAGYADGTLDEHRTALVEAHLAGCECCRHDVERQQILSERLQMIPAPGLSVDFDRRLECALANASAGGRRPSGRRHMATLKRLLNSLRSSVVIGGSGWAVALVLAGVLLMPSLKLDSINKTPMVRDVLADYQRVTREMLPIQAGGSEVSPPMPWANSQVLATWMTRVGGEPAQAYAMRQGNSLIIQYRISERVFFRDPDVRQAVARAGDFRTQSDQLEVLGLPMVNSGLLVVAPAGNLPPVSEATTGAS